MGSEKGTRSIMNVRILVYKNRVDVAPSVIWNTEKGGIHVFDVIYRVHPIKAPFLSIWKFPTGMLEPKLI